MHEVAKQQLSSSSSVNDVEDVEDWTEPLSTAAGLGIAETVRMAKSNEEERGPNLTADSSYLLCLWRYFSNFNWFIF